MCEHPGGCGVVTHGQFDKFKMSTNVTENQPIKNNNNYIGSNTNKMWFTTFSNMRSIMPGATSFVRSLKIVCYIKLKIIAFFSIFSIFCANLLIFSNEAGSFSPQSFFLKQ